MKAVFLAWTKSTPRLPVVFNGTTWLHSPTEKTHAEIGKKFEHVAALAMLNDMRTRYGGVEEIVVLPMATVDDVKKLAGQPQRRRKRR